MNISVNAKGRVNISVNDAARLHGGANIGRFCALQAGARQVAAEPLQSRCANLHGHLGHVPRRLRAGAAQRIPADC
eukprot:6849054-Prymnesium_polylepis.1